MRSPGWTRRFASLMRMRAPARSSRPVVVITDPRVGARRRSADRIAPECPVSPGRRAPLWKSFCPVPGHATMPLMHPSAPAGLPCPVCGTPVAVPAGAPCPVCGLPAVGSAALVVARIGATLTELTRDRDALLATLRMSAPGAAPVYAPAPPAPPVLPPAAAPPPLPPDP